VRSVRTLFDYALAQLPGDTKEYVGTCDPNFNKLVYDKQEMRLMWQSEPDFTEIPCGKATTTQ
jgi:hypothetical protein